MSRTGIKEILFLPVILSDLLTRCNQREMSGPTPEEGKYLIYYLNTSITKLVPREYETETTDKKALVGELMGQFLHVPKEPDCQVAFVGKVTYQGSHQEEQVLYLYFDVGYTGMKPEREILRRAALTRTLARIPRVSCINIYCDDQPLMDRQRNPVGILTSTDFIVDASSVNTYGKTEPTLYFTDETGNKLLEEKKEVMHSISISLEQLVVEQLIVGPGQEDHRPTLPSDYKILSLSVTDDVCYINSDSAFLNTSLPISEYMPIYSIVGSLSEMTTVTKIQIMVNGSQSMVSRDVISLNTPSEKSQDYIEGAQ